MIAMLEKLIYPIRHMVVFTSFHICMHIYLCWILPHKIFQSPLHTFYDLILLFIMAKLPFLLDWRRNVSLLLFTLIFVLLDLFKDYLPLHANRHTYTRGPNRYGSKVSLTKYKIYVSKRYSNMSDHDKRSPNAWVTSFTWSQIYS